METYFKSGLSQLHSSITNKKEIQQTMLSKFFKKDNKYYRDIQKQPKQIDIIDLIQIDFEDSPLQLQRMRSKLIHDTIDYNEWLHQRLQNVTKKQRIKAKFLFIKSREIFEANDCLLLQMFLKVPIQVNT